MSLISKLQRENLLYLSEANKKSFKRIMMEEVYQIADVAMYFHLNPQLSRSFKQDFVRTIKKFRKYSFTLELREFEGFKHLIQNSNLNHSTIEKYVTLLIIFFKDCCLAQDSKLDNFNFWAQSYLESLE